MTDAVQTNGPKTHSVIFVFITVFLDAMGIGLIMPVMPDLILELSDVDLSQAAIYGGYLTFVYALMQFLTGPTLGNLSDRYGRRPILLISLAALAIDYFIMAFSPNLIFLAVGRLIAGIAGATHSTAFAFTADVSTPNERTKNFGIVSAAFGAGFVAGPVIGGLIAEFGTRAPFFAAAALVLLNFLYGLVILPESLPKEKRRSFSWKRANPIGALLQAKIIPGMILFFVAFFVFNLASHIYPSIWPYYTREAFDWSSREIGLSLGAYGFFYALTQAFIIQLLLKRMKESTLAIAGVVIEALAMACLLFIFKGWIVFLFLPFTALGGIAAPAIQGLMSRSVSDDAQGELQGAISSLMAVTVILSPILMTQAFAFFTEKGTSYYHPAGAFGLTAILTLVVIFPLKRAISTTNRLR